MAIRALRLFISARALRALPQLKLGRIYSIWGYFLALSHAALSDKQAALACRGLKLKLGRIFQFWGIYWR
ncbi:MAG: hypothetical protein LBG07_08360 [Treponema sp.]|jgi:hypothetical protein|nr:hypothetical protein [Treponema sp.]